jgi:amidase
VKDWIDVSGFPCAGEAVANVERRPDADATAVARLRAAGAIVIAKSNANSLFATARNPFDRSRTPGYSSSGDAIAVAGGAVSLSIGSDSGGSLRFPAHCTGIATIKPTYGRVPATGHFPKIDGLTDGRTVIGPLARFVSDVRIGLDIISGADRVDPDSPPVAVGSYTLGAPLRVVLHQDETVDVRSDVASMIRQVADRLSDAGHYLSGSDVLRPTRALDITQRHWDRPLPMGTDTESLFSDWQAFKEYGADVMRRADVIISPAAPFPAPKIGNATDADWTYTLSPSLWGFPAAVVRGGTSPDGLPLGVQVVAPAWEDHRALAVAELIETLFEESPGVPSHSG